MNGPPRSRVQPGPRRETPGFQAEGSADSKGHFLVDARAQTPEALPVRQCIPSFESLTELSFLGEDVSQVQQVLHEGDSRWLRTLLQQQQLLSVLKNSAGSK